MQDASRVEQRGDAPAAGNQPLFLGIELEPAAVRTEETSIPGSHCPLTDPFRQAFTLLTLEETTSFEVVWNRIGPNDGALRPKSVERTLSNFSCCRAGTVKAGRVTVSPVAWS